MIAPMCDWKDWTGIVLVTDVEGRMYWINKPTWRAGHAEAHPEARDEEAEAVATTRRKTSQAARTEEIGGR